MTARGVRRFTTYYTERNDKSNKILNGSETRIILLGNMLFSSFFFLRVYYFFLLAQKLLKWFLVVHFYRLMC